MSKQLSRNKKSLSDKRINAFLIPGVLIFSILPIILRVYIGISSYSEYPWSSNDSEYVDFFLHGKVVFFESLTVLMVILIVFNMIKLKKDERIAVLKRFWPMIMYFAFILLSTVFSVCKTASIHGDKEQMEPVLVLVGYSVTACYFFMFLKNEKDIALMYSGVIVGAFMVSGIGILQMLGLKPLDSALVKWLSVPSALRGNVEFEGNWKSIASTLYNQNYVGPFVIVYLPLCLSAMFSKIHVWQKVAASITSLGLLAFLLSSKSKTGIVILFIVAVITFVFLFRPFLRFWFYIIPALAILACTLVTFINIKDPKYFGRLTKALEVEKLEYDLKGIDTTGDCIRILYKDHEIEITYEYDKEQRKLNGPVVNDSGVKCEVSETDTQGAFMINLSDGELIPITLVFIDKSDVGFKLKFGKKEFLFMKDDDNYLIVNSRYKRDESYISWTALDGYEKIVSGRGYIWRIVIPKLLDHIAVGAGPDCFPHGVFNKGNDYASVSRTSYSKTLFTRPHNYYLQMGIETGLLSLLACLIFFGWYLVDCIKLYFMRKPSCDMFYAGIGCMASIIGFLGTGLANDSLIVITPCFWAALGVGMAVNKMYRAKINETVAKK